MIRLPPALRWLTALAVFGVAHAAEPPAFPLTVPDTLAQRALACTGCHGPQGRATPDGYVPRIAGKPAGYLHQQLLSFRDGRRQHEGMARLLANLSDDYLAALAGHFAALDLPYATAAVPPGSAASMALGRQLLTRGDAARELPACMSCHGRALTGVAPAIPGLLGLPRDYVIAQFGAWRNGARKARSPDCMATLARRLQQQDIVAIADWLAAQPLPADTRPAQALPQALPIRCGSVSPMPTEDPAGQFTRGAYLARVGNCAGCHTARGGAPYAGGRGIATPFGTVYAGNLTPDPATGLGGWTADDFWRALHHGRSRDGRLLNPAFPYTEFTLVQRQDSDALFAFLRSLAPVAQPNRAHALRFPFNTQAALAVWRALYFKPARFSPDTTRSAEWNRGAYLVRGLGHCAACHAPRNGLGASRDRLDLAGGAMPMQSWYAPALGPAAHGESGSRHVIDLLQTGRSAQGTASGPMAEVVFNSTQHWSLPDLQAAAAYLRSLPLQPLPPVHAEPAPAGQMARGERLYVDRCAECHGSRGEGVPGAYPPLAGNPAVDLATPANLILSVLHGGFAPATAANPQPYGMPPQSLSDAEVAAVLTFIRRSWGHTAAAVSELDVLRQR